MVTAVVGVGGCTVHRDYKCREARARAAAMAASNAAGVISLRVARDEARWCHLLV